MVNLLLTTLIATVMTHEMPKLPYAHNALEPVISQQTIDFQIIFHNQNPLHHNSPRL